MSAKGNLEAATQDRKARLAALRGLKRKQPDESTPSTLQSDDQDVTTAYLCGRNYDRETRGPKLGFESQPNEDKDTLEVRAAALSEATKREQEKEEEEKDAPIDLFKLQPKKPNWDLKRDFRERCGVLDVRTKNAIAKLVRERLEGEKKREGGEVGMEGEELVQAVRVREQQDEEERRREREEDEAGP